MEKLSLKSYVVKCVLGSEIAYFICLFGGLLPMRTPEISKLHHALFELLPGFVWINARSVIFGAMYMLIFSVVFGSYMVWMHNSSLINK